MAKNQKNIADLTDQEIKTSIENHERVSETTSPRYCELVEEHAQRLGKGLREAVSLAHLKQAAKQKHFTTYGALAEENGVPWAQARRRMDGAHGHLDDLLSVCHARGLPLLTALCVNKEGLADGSLSEVALSGFIKGAQRLGYKVTDESAFLRQCQDQCFAWGESMSSETG
jgi:hypothetical protein